MKRTRVWVALAVLAVLAYVVYSSMETAQISCEACVEFGGRRQCRTAAGATREEAIQTAVTSACATLAGGMTDSIRCDNTPPYSVTCQDR